MKNATRLCVVGGAGRMGQLTSARALERADCELVSVLDRKVGVLSLPAAIVTSTDPKEALVDPSPPVQVAIDFSAPSAARALLPICAARQVAYLVASTGLSAADHKAIEAAASAIAVVVAANCSIGVNLLHELVTLAASRLGASFDVEIAELHHRHKKDAPSGTALSLGRAVEAGRGELDHRLGRAGSEPERDAGQLGFAALRGGDVSGEHTVHFLGQGERLELTHRATRREIFADGALSAARWLAGRAPGLYSMGDVLAGE